MADITPPSEPTQKMDGHPLDHAVGDAAALYRDKIGELSLLRELADCYANVDDEEMLASSVAIAIQSALQIDACALFAAADQDGWRYLAGVSLDPVEVPPEAVPPGLLDLADKSPDQTASTGGGQLAICLRQGPRRSGILVLTDPEVTARWNAKKPLFAIVVSMLANMLETARMIHKMTDTNNYLESTLEQRTADLKATQEQLHQKEKLASLGQLVTGVSHELNNRLVPILGYAQLLKGQELEESVDRPIRAIEAAALGSKRIVDDLLCFAHPAPPAREATDMAQLAAEVVDAVRVGQGEDTRISLHCDPDVSAAHVDRRQLEQVLHNLIKNALHALGESEDGHVRVTLSMEANRVLLGVEDNGIGIPTDIQGRIFEPFFSTKGVGKGTGLGLSLGYGLTQANGGTMKVQSREGFGSRFTVSLPVDNQIPKGGKNVKPEANSNDTKPKVPRDIYSSNSLEKKRILVVEDEPNIREFLIQALAGQFDVSTAENGLMAQSALTESGFDVVLMDLRMPKQGGMELFNWLDATHPETAARVVFMTGDLYDQEANTFLGEKQNGHLLKPFTLAELESALQEATS
jgi:signal transduction histidine kinase